MRHRIFPYRPFAAMTTLWTLGGLLLACAILLDCGAVRAGEKVSHQYCAMEIQARCRELNEKLAETTGTFSSNHGNNSVMCGYFLQMLKCVAEQVHVCSDWFLEVNSYYFQSPFDCKMTGQFVQEIQDIQSTKRKGGNSGSDGTGNDGGSATTPDDTGGNEGVTSGNGGDGSSDSTGRGGSSPKVNDTATNSDHKNTSSSVVDSGKTAEVDKNGGYTVANVHGDKAQQAGNGSSRWSTLGMSLLISAALMPRLISKYLVL